MKRTTQIIAKFVYGATGVGFLAVGATTLLVNTGLVPDALRNVVIEFSQNNLGMLHIVQEFGSVMVLLGLLTLWFVWRYDESRFFHWAMTAYWAIMALIHWFNVAGPNTSIVGPLVITVPFLGFLTIGVLRAATEGERMETPTRETTIPFAQRERAIG